VTCPVSAIPAPRPCRSHSVAMSIFLLIAACGFASAEIPKAKPSPCALTDAETAGLNGDASIDIHTVSNFSKTIYSLLTAGEFERLDCIADSTRSHKETFPGGMWKIHAVYSGLEKPPVHPTQEDWDIHMQLVRKWMLSRPESITARIASAESYVNYGWDARGPGFASTVSASGWRLLAERTAKAKQILEETSALSTKDPEWYVAMQNVALAQGWEPTAKQALLEQAIKFEPTYYYYYRMYADSIQPRWGGEDGEVGRFLQKAADQLGGDAGDIVYFRVAGYLVCLCQTDQQLNLAWPRIQKGFEAAEKRYGASPENWNLMAHMAVSFGECETADKLLIRIGDQWSEDVWLDSSAFESAKQWAKQIEPVIAKKRPAEEAAEANLQTAEGQTYNAVFAEKIHTWMQPCIEELAGKDLGKFELLIKVGQAGTIDEITGGGLSPVMPCLGRKLNGFRQEKQVVFPPPPQPAYWVRLDFNQADAASAALK
jgi:hypothetical protein